MNFSGFKDHKSQQPCVAVVLIIYSFFAVGWFVALGASPFHDGIPWQASAIAVFLGSPSLVWFAQKRVSRLCLVIAICLLLLPWCVSVIYVKETIGFYTGDWLFEYMLKRYQ